MEICSDLRYFPTPAEDCGSTHEKAMVVVFEFGTVSKANQ